LSASGLGKSQFGEILPELLKGLSINNPTLSNIIRNHSWYTMIEFNGRGDRMSYQDTNPENAMAIRLLARGLFGISTESFRSHRFMSTKEENLLQPQLVMEEIVKEIRAQTLYAGDIFFYLHIDEYQLTVFDQTSERFMKVIN